MPVEKKTTKKAVKKAAAKPAEVKPAAIKPVEVKAKPAPKKPAVKKAAAPKGKTVISQDRFYAMVSEAAYFSAQNDGNLKSSSAYWLEAEEAVRAKFDVAG